LIGAVFVVGLVAALSKRLQSSPEIEMGAVDPVVAVGFMGMIKAGIDCIAGCAVGFLLRPSRKAQSSFDTDTD
jgi:hypothetical protein